eukprot:CAMPEP_0119530256 /NCGR_PEP_ID=MMETSP1344-20130328/44105_1 /TAXON_ID=236787 /ORGANISM="Florenciella parvula, Strain CCMP2471" /LENGTH=34 /DNA_ID= /DNA_START= /DNA_END= /DNA_ORIENTATION=
MSVARPVGATAARRRATLTCGASTSSLSGKVCIV